MADLELFVSLKIPDTTAITAFHTLERMGFSKLKKLSRKDYYYFDIEDDEKEFKSRICKVDTLVNANKHRYEFSLSEKKEDYAVINVLVTNSDDDGSSLISQLRSFGIENINKASKGVLWTLGIDADKEEAKLIAENIAKELLSNEHYQEYKLLS